MNKIITNMTNWKVFVPVLGVALIIGAVIYNTDTNQLSQNTTPVGETTAEVQVEKVEVEVEAATLDEAVKVPAEESTEK